MKVSIITASLNNAATIAGCVDSITTQTYGDIEHIVTDGGSTDGTLGVIDRHENRVTCWRTGPDNGLYDAINIGIAMTTGDIIGILNADDLYADERVIGDVVRTVRETGCDTCYGDLVYVHARETCRVIRYWVSGRYRPGSFRSRGWMPPHPTFFVRREVYERYGLFDTRFRIAADYELMLRLLEKHRVSTCYVPRVLVRMRMGGVSNGSLRDMACKSCEDYRARQVNRLRPSLLTLAMKNLRKLPQFFRRCRAPVGQPSRVGSREKTRASQPRTAVPPSGGRPRRHDARPAGVPAVRGAE